MTSSEAVTRLSHWYRQWRSPLRKFLITRGAIPVASLDDVAQEVFLRLLRYDKAEGIEYPQAYIFKMAANVASEWRSQSRFRLPHEAKWLNRLPDEQMPEDNVDRRAAEKEVGRALNVLSARQRLILKLHYSEGLGRAEIAARIGSTERIVKRELARSYDVLRGELSADLLGVITDGCE